MPSSIPSLSISQAADQLGVRPDAIREWIRQGKMPAKRVAGEWNILTVDLERFERPKRGRPKL